MLKYKIKVQYLNRVFRWADEDEHQLMVQAARLAILYQDFQLELEGVMASALEPLDGHSAEARRLYFLRRHTLTFDEIGNAIRMINGNRYWKHVRKNVTQEYRKPWDRAVAFFNTQKNRLTSIRNDLGGHVLDEAADYAIQNVRSTTVGTIEVYRRGSDGGDVRPKFAHELVAVALKRTMPAGMDEEALYAELFGFMRQTMQHVVMAVQILFDKVFWPRF